jgi:VIT1/CCC1 family predicted Fe2+/Mn2+ transporter
VLTWVQPGLAGLMDGSVSTLAPIFATAFATQDTWTTFLVGLAASVGAGISMGFTEAASDDGELSGRGSPVKRGFASGIMTTLGGLGHALPYLIPDFWTATITAIVVVFVELWAIVWIQNRFMETPFLRATFQVVLGGALVFAAGALIGGGARSCLRSTRPRFTAQAISTRIARLVFVVSRIPAPVPALCPIWVGAPRRTLTLINPPSTAAV